MTRFLWAFLLAAGLSTSAQAADPTGWAGRLVDRISVGGAMHGRDGHEGIDLVVEVQMRAPFSGPGILRFRPTLGGSVNFDDGANAGYGGLTWTLYQHAEFYLDGFFGFAVHDNPTPFSRSNLEHFGCPWQFRQALEIGYRHGQHRLGALASHMSNGNVLCESDKNDGLDWYGLRYSLGF